MSANIPTSKSTVYRKDSYSQSGEDLIISFIFNILGIDNPTYLDVGAHHPDYINNTAIFYQNGSKGVNIEPDPELFKQFTTNRPRDINLNIGITRTKGVLDFYIMSSPTLNTFSKKEAKEYENNGFTISHILKVKTQNINTTINQTLGKAPDLLNLDAEGINLEILQTLNFNKFKPKIICAETISYSTTGHGRKDNKLIKFLLANGYILYADTYINTIFVEKKLWVK